jgi:uncharacterized membrane protein YphA (DoxX/SURF4 family)
MGRRIKLRHVPPRITTGAYILHSGLEKWKGDENTAGYIHAMAGGAIPPLKNIPAPQFLKLLAGAEIALGAALLNPLIPTKVVGLGLTAFSGSLLTMYARTPSLHKPGSIWPSQQGIAVSKDVWMAGIGLSFLVDSGKGRKYYKKKYSEVDASSDGD